MKQLDGRCARIITATATENARRRTVCARTGLVTVTPWYVTRRCCNRARDGSRFCRVHPAGGIAWPSFYRWLVWRRLPVFGKPDRDGHTPILRWRMGWLPMNVVRRGERHRPYTMADYRRQEGQRRRRAA